MPFWATASVSYAIAASTSVTYRPRYLQGAGLRFTHQAGGDGRSVNVGASKRCHTCTSCRIAARSAPPIYPSDAASMRRNELNVMQDRYRLHGQESGHVH